MADGTSGGSGSSGSSGGDATGIVVLVCGCHKYEATHRAAIAYFAEASQCETIGVVGRAPDAVADDDDFSSFEFDAERRLLVVPTSDLYEHLPSKIHAALRWIHAHRPACTGVFKTDDDIRFQTDDDLVRFREALRTNASKDYWGFYLHFIAAGIVHETRIAWRFADKTLRPTYPQAHYCYGHGYGLSRKSLDLIVDTHRADYEAQALEDVCTGFCLNSHDIWPVLVSPLIKYLEIDRSKAIVATSSAPAKTTIVVPPPPVAETASPPVVAPPHADAESSAPAAVPLYATTTNSSPAAAPLPATISLLELRSRERMSQFIRTLNSNK